MYLSTHGSSTGQIESKFTRKSRKKSKVRTFTPRSTGSLLIMSTNGGLLRGLPVVSKSPSIGVPYTLAASQRLFANTEWNNTQETINLLHKMNKTVSDTLPTTSGHD